MTHTPAPWSINEWLQKDSRISIGANGTPLIAYVPIRDVSVNEQKANAALIASAPDLLSALEYLRECIENVTEPAMSAVNAAISHAKGEFK